MNEFIDFLYQHFPHRWLNTKAQGTEKLFTGLSKSLEYGMNWVGLISRNNSLRTVEELVTALENEYGLTVNPSYDIDFRRKRITAKMRIQDSPVTKNDLIKMIESLGFHHCKIKNELNKYVMNVRFDMTEGSSDKVSEVVKLLNENVRAHIDFLIDIMIAINVKNETSASLHRLIISAYVRNLDLEFVVLDGTRLLDGSWYLLTISRAVSMHKFSVIAVIKSYEAIIISMGIKIKSNTKEKILLRGAVFKSSLKAIEYTLNTHFKMNVFISESNSTSVKLITDTMWHLNGSQMLCGNRKLNAEIKETIL